MMIKLNRINYMIMIRKYYMNKKNIQNKLLVSYIMLLVFYHIVKEL